MQNQDQVQHVVAEPPLPVLTGAKQMGAPAKEGKPFNKVLTLCVAILMLVCSVMEARSSIIGFHGQDTALMIVTGVMSVGALAYSIYLFLEWLKMIRVKASQMTLEVHGASGRD